MKYIVIYRSIFNNYFIVRNDEKSDGILEILEPSEEYYEDYLKDKEKIVLIENDEEIDFFWDEWASKELWNDEWVNPPEEEKCDEDSISYFNTLEEAFKYKNRQEDLL